MNNQPYKKKAGNKNEERRTNNEYGESTITSYRLSGALAAGLLLNLLSTAVHAVAVSGQGTRETMLQARDFVLLASIMMLLSGCTMTAPEAPKLADGAILLFIGQDRIAIQDYVDAGEFPAPGGVVNYANIYDDDDIGLVDSKRRGERVEMNLRQTLADHPQSIGMLGLYMVEGGDHADGLTGIVEGRYDERMSLLARVAGSCGPAQPP